MCISRGGAEMRVAVTGASGQLGTDLMRVLNESHGFEPTSITRHELDVRDDDRVRDTLTQLRPDVVINAAAFTRVDRCEYEPELAFAVNGLGARNVARACAELGCIVIHISTDYVFDGEKGAPYVEGDLPNPVNAYGVSKLAGEFFVRSTCSEHFIVRTSGLYGTAGVSGGGGNFVEAMLRLAAEDRPVRVVDDQTVSPTYTKDLAAALIQLPATKDYGTWHIVNAGQCSWFDFTREIFAALDIRAEVQPISSQAYGARAKRPACSVLTSQRMTDHPFVHLRPRDTALNVYLQERNTISGGADGQANGAS